MGLSGPAARVEVRGSRALRPTVPLAIGLTVAAAATLAWLLTPDPHGRTRPLVASSREHPSAVVLRMRAQSADGSTPVAVSLGLPDSLTVAGEPATRTLAWSAHPADPSSTRPVGLIAQGAGPHELDLVLCSSGACWHSAAALALPAPSSEQRPGSPPRTTALAASMHWSALVPIHPDNPQEHDMQRHSSIIAAALLFASTAVTAAPTIDATATLSTAEEAARFNDEATSPQPAAMTPPSETDGMH